MGCDVTIPKADMKYIFGGLLTLFLLGACSKKTYYQAEGTLTGVDGTTCACCGGVVLVIDGNPGNFRIDSLPFMTPQQLYNTTFPKRIKLNYTATTCGNIEHLKVGTYIMH